MVKLVREEVFTNIRHGAVVVGVVVVVVDPDVGSPAGRESAAGAAEGAVSPEPPHPVRPTIRIALTNTFGTIINEPLVPAYGRIRRLDTENRLTGAEAADPWDQSRIVASRRSAISSIASSNRATHILPWAGARAGSSR